MPDRSLAQLLYARLLAQADLFATFTSHTTLTGGGRERALRSLVGEMLPRRYEALAGTVAIIDPVSKTRTRLDRQLDLLVVDTLTYPVLVRDGDVAVVLPDAVRVVVEVKSEITAERHLHDTLDQVVATRRAIDPQGVIFTALFAYDSTPEPETLRRWFAAWCGSNAQTLNPILLPDLFINAQGLLAGKTMTTTDGTLSFWKNRLGDSSRERKWDPSAAIVYLLDQVLQRIAEDGAARFTPRQQAVFTEVMSVVLGVQPPTSAGVAPLVLPRPAG